jgi:hypothetical protein
MTALAGYAICLNEIVSCLLYFDYEYAILEKQDDILFVGKGRIKSTGDFTQWDKGRLFGTDGEVKWVRKTKGFHVIAISDQGKIPEGFQRKEIELIEEKKLLLWGEHIIQTDKSMSLPEQWYELRIPRFIEYPFKPIRQGGRIRLAINEYCFKDKSTIHRYVGLEEVVDEN